ncbi:MAG TPA: hypothetical protein VNN80_22970, partial [Polyangiaceae bacterium]|nr:hypothetical protein [Polyangiaceae bacterium]
RSVPRQAPLLGLALGLASAACDEGAGLENLPGANGTGGVPRVPRSVGAAENPLAAPALRGPVTLSDAELAPRALTLMGSAAVGASGSCSSCHAIGRPTLTRWSRLTADFTRACLGDTTLVDSAAVDAMLDCFSANAPRASTLAPAQFGVYAAAAHLPWFEFLFQNASGAGADWRRQHDDFVSRVGMPRSGAPWSQVQFDEVAEWFARGLPLLFELVPEDRGEDCAPVLDARLAEHVTAMAASGWRARNEQVPLLMYGCEPGQAGASCLSDYPLARDVIGESWEAPGGAVIRLLYDNSETRSTFWSRCSPDGRYVASGRLRRGPDGYRGQFVDLARGEPIGADFSYDPTFFPDNSGFLVQRDGGNGNGSSGPSDGTADPGDVALVCEQSVLAGDPLEISGDEDQCIQLGSQIGLYQQLAKSLDGDDYWVVFGSYDADNGGLEPVLSNPSAAFEARSTTTLVPMLNLGSGFEPGTPARIQTPEQGDPMLSPSGRLLVTRIKGAERASVVDGKDVVTAEQSGYALHLLSSQQQGGEWDVQLSDVGRICLQGGKAVVSYDERWIVFHHYVTESDARSLGYSGPADPAFERYLELGASDLYLVDLLDGSTRPITSMGAGEYALFPHFRSDGWIYFVVRTLDGREYFAATDAALLLDGGQGD